jgi:nucleoside 2-deoxyribosyltransferase
MNDKTKVYLAAPLFSISELEFNLTLVLLLQDNCPGVEIFLPQKIEYVNSEQVFRACRQGVLDADLRVGDLIN